MKKMLAALLCCLLLVGCAVPGSGTTDPSDTTEATAQTHPTATQATDPGTTEAESTDPSAETAPSTQPSEASTAKFTLYTPNDTLDGFYATDVVIEQLSAPNVAAELVKENVLNDAIIIHSAVLAEGQLTLDFNSAFADLIYTQGTSGERMIIGSVVNTFLSAYGSQGAQTVYVTVDGQILESGHVVYDFPMSFFE